MSLCFTYNHENGILAPYYQQCPQGPEALASPWNLLEMQHLRLYHRSTQKEFVHESERRQTEHTVCFENHDVVIK